MQTMELIGDNTFSGGFYLQAVDGSQGKVLDFALPGRQEAVWKIAQHFSRFDLTQNAIFTVRPNGQRVYENSGKKITLAKDEAGAWVITLETICSQEYRHSRKEGEAWPHLLIEQDMASRYLDQYTALPFTMCVKKEYLHSGMEEDYDPALHCFQSSLFFVVQNRNQASPDYGDFMWFGVPVLDSRYEYKELHIAEDCGKEDASQKLIGCLGGRDWYRKHYDCNPMSGEWATVKVDLLPFIRDMVEIAHQRHYLMGTTFSDLQFGSMNLGIEAPGTFDGAMSIKNISLLGVVDGNACG